MTSDLLASLSLSLSLRMPGWVAITREQKDVVPAHALLLLLLLLLTVLTGVVVFVIKEEQKQILIN